MVLKIIRSSPRIRICNGLVLTSDVRATGCQYRLRYSPQGVPGSVCDIVSSLFGSFDYL